jgi:hypothetical protein
MRRMRREHKEEFDRQTDFNHGLVSGTMRRQDPSSNNSQGATGNHFQHLQRQFILRTKYSPSTNDDNGWTFDSRQGKSSAASESGNWRSKSEKGSPGAPLEFSSKLPHRKHGNDFDDGRTLDHWQNKHNLRSPTLSAVPAPIPTSPMQSYLDLTLEPSTCISRTLDTTTSAPASAPRKLLILDLNGTLLVRSQAGSPHPRPYMPSLRDYLFDSRTRKWLDVMVWSSAQTRNVEKMVRRCFFDVELGEVLGEQELEQQQGSKSKTGDKWGGKLTAVWARDTLGLSKSEFCQSFLYNLIVRSKYNLDSSFFP